MSGFRSQSHRRRAASVPGSSTGKRVKGDGALETLSITPMRDGFNLVSASSRRDASAAKGNDSKSFSNW